MLDRSSVIKALGFTFVAASLVACDRGEPVDNETTSQALSTNIENVSDSLGTALTAFETSELFNTALESPGLIDGGDDCVASPDGDDFGCEESFEAPDFDAELEQARTELDKLLTDHVFVEGNIESSERREITYLIKGQNVCSYAGLAGPELQECITVVDSMQLRLVVTSPQENDISIDVLVGDSRYNPISLDIWQDKLAVELGLGDIVDSAKFLADTIDGEDISEDIPDTIKGRVRAELSVAGAQSVATRFSVLEAVQIADAEEGFDIKLAVADPAVTMIMDGAAKTIDYEVNWSAISLTFPETSGEGYYDDVTGEYIEEEGTTHTYALALAGLTGQGIFSADDESVTLNNLGLGDGKATLDIDTKRVFEADLNPNAGRAFDVTVAMQEQDGEESVDITVSPELDLSLAFKFAQLANAVEDFDIEPWMMDETLDISFSGTTPTLHVADELVKVVSGTLSLTSVARGETITVNADQCLVDAYEDHVCEPTAVGVDGEDASPSPEQPACGEETGDDHPFAYISAGACE